LPKDRFDPSEQLNWIRDQANARAVGLGDEIGSIEVGKKADLALLDMSDFFVSPIHDPISTLVHSALGHEPTLVVIDGKIVMRNRKVLTVDERRVKRAGSSLSWTTRWNMGTGSRTTILSSIIPRVATQPWRISPDNPPPVFVVGIYACLTIHAQILMILKT
jgi:hypothetical protein